MLYRHRNIVCVTVGSTYYSCCCVYYYFNYTNKDGHCSVKFITLITIVKVKHSYRLNWLTIIIVY